MKNYILAVFCLIGCLSHANAQYKPDTSLNYPTFLDQCIEFSSQTGADEVWVVHFWASWSSASLVGIPGLKGLHKKYANKPVRFVGASVDKVEKLWVRSLKKFEMPWEHLIINKESDYTFIRRAFRHNSLPGLFLVDRNGKVLRAKSTQELDQMLSEITAELPNKPYKPATETSQPEEEEVVVIDLAEDKPPVEETNTEPEEEVIVSEPEEEVVVSEPEEVEDLPTPTPPTVNEVEPSPPTPNPTPQATTWVMHKVKKGETLYRISRNYNVSVDQIRQLNSLSGNLIVVGQDLKIKKIL